MEIVHLLFFQIIAYHNLVFSSFLREDNLVRNPTVVFLGTVVERIIHLQ
jgi:hypothetical protein